MAKPEWGTKRMCQSCGARYYDMRRDPPVCPKCETVFAPRSSTRQRRGAAVAAEEPTAVKPEKAKKKVKAVEEEAIEEFEDDAVDSEEEDVDLMDSDDEDNSLLEDASELGEDDDDVSEVMEHLDDEDLSDRS